MSNSIPTAPAKVGFPQAYNQQYQYVQQFGQYAQQQTPAVNTAVNGQLSNPPNPFPFPSAATTSNQMQQTPGTFSQSSISKPGGINGHGSTQQHQYGQPPVYQQSQIAPNAAAAASLPPSQYTAPPNISYQSPPTIGMVQPNSITPQPNGKSMAEYPNTAMTSLNPNNTQVQYPNISSQMGVSSHVPPGPILQNNNVQQQQMTPRVPIAPMQPQMPQVTQQFGQMNMGSTRPMNSQMANNQYRSDVIDLMAERNVQQYGFHDVDINLPQQVASPETKIDQNIFRSTLQNVPQSEELLNKSRLPFAITLHPFRDVKNLNIIQTSNIVRCRYCRTYINPYVYLPDQRHWKCNLCNRNNDLPDDFSWDPVTKSFGDPRNRPEIQNATVEFIAPSEYMLRPPQPPIYVFLLDVSAEAIQSGYLNSFCEQFLINVDQMPGDDRAQIAFIAVDQCLHFFSFNSTKRLPCEMVVDDIDDAFIPAVSSLLVSMKKYKDIIIEFVKNLPSLYSCGATSNGNCLGSALKIVYQLINEIGGRISVFQVSLPTLGEGALKNREESEGQNYGPSTDFYKGLSLECTGNQICMDLFMLNTQYADLATLSEISKFSTGCVYHFPNFNSAQNLIQVKKFEKCLTRYLTRKIGFEAVLRIRTTRGLALTGFYGNFFVRSPDLLAFANVNPDSALSAQVTIEEKLPAYVCFQSALLYTSSKGDRRIRVHTMCLPTTGDLLQLYNHFDLKATVSYLAKIGVERSMTGSALADSREALVNAVVDSVGAFQKAVSRGGSMLVPRSGHLRLFPTYVLAMLKHPAFSSSRGIRLDERTGSMLMLRFSPLEQILSDIYPKLYRLNELINNDQELSPLPLSFEHIHRDGVYLMEAGSAVYVYIPSTADASLLHSMFGCSYNDIAQNSLQELDNDVSRRVFAFIKRVIQFKFYAGPIIIIKEHSPLRDLFVRRLVDDRSESTHSYVEFLQHLKREINSYGNN